MKKLLLTVLMFLIMITQVYAQNRGYYAGTFASSYSVTKTQTTITLPDKARDIAIYNGATDSICVGLRGGTLNDFCLEDTARTMAQNTANPAVIRLSGNTSINLNDYNTPTITFKAIDNSTTASPVTVVIKY